MHSFHKGLKNTANILFVLSFIVFLFTEGTAQEPAKISSPADSGNTSETKSKPGSFKKDDSAASLKKEYMYAGQAREYRSKGLELQRIGDLGGAMEYYQKAIILDPSYAIVYNDLGIVYEAKGLIDQAEQCYLQAMNIDPNYLSVYSNLALLYENKRDLDRAAFYWEKRKQFGPPEDPWTQKAKNRLDDLMQVVPDLREKVIEQETMVLIKDVAEKKRIKKLEDLKKADQYLKSAKRLCDKAEYKKAIDELQLSLSLDPANKEVQPLMEMAKSKLREQQKQEQIKDMQLHFKNALIYCQQDNPQAAKQELSKIEELTGSLQPK